MNARDGAEARKRDEGGVMLDRWTAVDDYIAERLIPPDAALAAALAASLAEGLPAIQVSATQGKLLHLLVRIQGARTILEIGTLGGYSAIWMARALPPGGRLITLESEPRHAELARRNIARAGLDPLVEVRTGRALDLLPGLESEGVGPFDFVFIDADKPNNPRYLEWAFRLARPGTVIVADNVVRGGEIVDAGSTDASVQGTRALFDALAAEPRVDATAIQTVGSKGYDGLAVCVVGSGS